MVFQRFYTYPPIECEWQWILRNIKQKPLPCTHEIVDIGIYDLLRPPFKHSDDKIKKWKQLQTEGWKVVPDCPDLIGEFEKPILKNLFKGYNNNVGIQCQRFINYWWNYVHEMDNTEYSWELLTTLYDPLDEHQLPVIQSRYGNLESLINYCDRFTGLFGKPDKIAVGSVCKMDNNKTSIKMLKQIRRKFNNSWIHAFGLRFQQFKKGYMLIDSYDSTSWTFPRQSGRGSCKNQEERLEFFNDYIKRIEEVTFSINTEQGVLI